MADHAHHPAVEEKPNAGKVMGFALFFAMTAIIVVLVGMLRTSQDILNIAGVLAVVAAGLGVVGVIVAKAKGGTTRGFAVVVLLAAVTLVVWAVVGAEL
jgi:hypothetical protein